jgi:hypothetical protein
MIFGLGRIRTTDTKNCNPRMLGFHQERRQAAEIYHRTTIAISGAPPSLSPERHHHRHRSPIHPRSKLDASPTAALQPPSPRWPASVHRPTPPPHIRSGCPRRASSRCGGGLRPDEFKRLCKQARFFFIN